MTLPTHPTLSWLLSFWSTAHAVLVLLIAIPAALTGWPAASIVLLAVIAAVAAAGVARLEIAAAAYRKWNRLAAWYTALVRAALIGGSFIVVTIASRLPPAGRQASAATPTWAPKRSRGIDTFDGMQRRRAASGWISRYAAWSRGSDNLWSLCLLPFVLLLLALETKEDTRVPERLYTLY